MLDSEPQKSNYSTLDKTTSQCFEIEMEMDLLQVEKHQSLAARRTELKFSLAESNRTTRVVSITEVGYDHLAQD